MSIEERLSILEKILCSEIEQMQMAEKISGNATICEWSIEDRIVHLEGKLSQMEATMSSIRYDIANIANILEPLAKLFVNSGTSISTYHMQNLESIKFKFHH